MLIVVSLDNTNADTEVRSKWIELASRHAVPIRCVLFTTAAAVCEHNDVVRALNDVVCHPPPEYGLSTNATQQRACEAD
jgi:hypothetical protein